MSLKAIFTKYTFDFKFEAGTSRGVLTQRDCYFIKIFDTENPSVYGLGEAAPLKGLSVDDRPDFELGVFLAVSVTKPVNIFPKFLSF